MKIEMRVLPNEKSGEVFGVQRNKAPDLFRRAVRIFTGMVNGTTDRIYKGRSLKQVRLSSRYRPSPNRSHVSHKDLRGKIPGQSSQKRCVRYNFKCGEFPRLSSSPYNVDT